jgi:ribosome maturation factor RimP
MGFDIVRIKYLSGGPPTLQIMAERENGEMNVDDCADLSHAVSVLLDVDDPISGEYSLEVSSPGVDRPLVRKRDFERYIGHAAKVELDEPIKGRKKLKGVLVDVDENSVVMDVRNFERTVVPLANIADAQLILTDALIEEALKGESGKQH